SAVQTLLGSELRPVFCELVTPVAESAAAVAAAPSDASLFTPEREPLGETSGKTSGKSSDETSGERRAHALLLALGFSGTREEVAWQLDAAERLLGETQSAGPGGPLETARAAWDRLYPRLL